MTPLTTVTSSVSHRTIESFRVMLDDDASTTLHVARYPKSTTRPRLVLFDSETPLLDWCIKNNVSDAMGGGFFLRTQHKSLGDIWINGEQQATVPFVSPWDLRRGSLYITDEKRLAIAPRYLLPQQPEGDLLQAGPILVQQGSPMVHDSKDPEGFSAGSHQFDTDITAGRYPRSAVGSDDCFIYSIACDGYGQGEAGMTFGEFARAIADHGIKDALNLDGGSSSSLIYGQRLVNRSLTGLGELFERGRPIFSALVFG